MTLATTNLKPEQVQELLKGRTPGEWYLAINNQPCATTTGEEEDAVLLGGPIKNRSDAEIMILAPELAQGYVTLHAAVLTLVELGAEHRAWLEATPPGLRGEEHEGFVARFDAAYTALALAVGK